MTNAELALCQTLDTKKEKQACIIKLQDKEKAQNDAMLQIGQAGMGVIGMLAIICLGIGLAKKITGF